MFYTIHSKLSQKIADFVGVVIVMLPLLVIYLNRLPSILWNIFTGYQFMIGQSFVVVVFSWASHRMFFLGQVKLRQAARGHTFSHRKFLLAAYSFIATFTVEFV